MVINNTFLLMKSLGVFGNTPEKAIKQIKNMSWKKLCFDDIDYYNNKVNDNFCSLVGESNDNFMKLLKPTAAIFSIIEYSNNRIAYFFSADGKSIEACKYEIIKI